MSKSISKNSLKTDKKFRVFNPIKLLRSFVSCFGLALLSMAGNCPWLAEPPKPPKVDDKSTPATAQPSETNNVIALDPSYVEPEQPTQEEEKKTTSDENPSDSLLETLRDADLEKACPICKHDFTEEDTAVCTLNCDCKYAYHLDCIQKALAIKHSCPTCRGSVHTLTSIVDRQVIPVAATKEEDKPDAVKLIDLLEKQGFSRTCYACRKPFEEKDRDHLFKFSCAAQCNYLAVFHRACIEKDEARAGCSKKCGGNMMQNVFKPSESVSFKPLVDKPVVSSESEDKVLLEELKAKGFDQQCCVCGNSFKATDRYDLWRPVCTFDSSIRCKTSHVFHDSCNKRRIDEERRCSYGHYTATSVGLQLDSIPFPQPVPPKEEPKKDPMQTALNERITAIDRGIAAIDQEQSTNPEEVSNKEKRKKNLERFKYGLIQEKECGLDRRTYPHAYELFSLHCYIIIAYLTIGKEFHYDSSQPGTSSDWINKDPKDNTTLTDSLCFSVYMSKLNKAALAWDRIRK